jgi:hypothetical protein
MFISKKEKEKIYTQISFLKDLIEYLSERVFQLEGWIPVQAKEPIQKSTAYKWVKEFQTPQPKKRGRPVGSKNKVKK